MNQMVNYEHLNVDPKDTIAFGDAKIDIPMFEICGYGVCTDVVAYALKEAGYDLMELVLNDIEIHGDMYDIEIPDQNIDFRRVKNLYVFFNIINHQIHY